MTKYKKKKEQLEAAIKAVSNGSLKTELEKQITSDRCKYCNCILDSLREIRFGCHALCEVTYYEAVFWHTIDKNNE